MDIDVLQEHRRRVGLTLKDVVFVKLGDQPNQRDLESLEGSVSLMRPKKKKLCALVYMPSEAAAIQLCKNQLPPSISEAKLASLSTEHGLFFTPCLVSLKVHSLPEDIRINEVATYFPRAFSIELRLKRRTNLFVKSKIYKTTFGQKEAILRFELRKDCLQSFLKKQSIKIRGHEYIVTFGKINATKK